MDRTELAEHLTKVDETTPYYQLLILDFTGDRPAWWACNLDGREIDPNVGCPDHAPRNIPGLAPVECEADPPHAPMWRLDGEHNGYGNPCPSCVYNGVAADLRKATKTDRCYHWPWRRWAATKWAAGKAYSLGVISGYSLNGHAPGGWCVGFHRALRGKRPYLLGVSRETWRCWLIGHHRRGEEVGFGFCGKCVPWPCCGSQRQEHVAGCVEDDQRAGGGGAMREPDNHTAVVDRGGDTWVRDDETPGQYGNWWPLTDGPGWEPWARNSVGQARTWDQVDPVYAPFVQADPDRTARALERVRQEANR
jgi:hypothetical protein